jgi:hypothetical protein
MGEMTLNIFFSFSIEKCEVTTMHITHQGLSNSNKSTMRTLGFGGGEGGGGYGVVVNKIKQTTLIII